MSVEGVSTKERQGPEDAEAAQDVYIKLKTLQKHMEFLDIQVGGICLGSVMGQSDKWNQILRLVVVKTSLDFLFFFTSSRKGIPASTLTPPCNRKHRFIQVPTSG